MTDAETSAAIAALAYRVKARDEAIRDGGDYPDAEPFALEFMTVLRGQGWRHTEAKTLAAATKTAPKADAARPAASRREELLAPVRAQMDAINASKRAALEEGAA